MPYLQGMSKSLNFTQPEVIFVSVKFLPAV